MAAEQHPVSILIADVCSSTRLYEILGDRAANRLVIQYIKTLSTVAENSRGWVVKTMGDSVLCCFHDPDRSIEAAQQMQTEVAVMSSTNELDLTRIRVRVAVHTGPVIKQDNDIFGDAVNVAARLAEFAKPGQILISDETLTSLCADFDCVVRAIGTFTVKGRKQKLSVHEMVWDQDDITFMNREPDADAPSGYSIELHYGGRTITIDHTGTVFSIGRHSTSHLFIDAPSVSRHHAEIEFRNGKFYLQDRSTNGTHLRTSDGTRVFLHFDGCILQGRGVFSLGSPIAEDPSVLIQYSLRNSQE